VLDLGGDRQLAARLRARDDQRLELRARGIERRGQARGAGTEDDDVPVALAGRHRFSIKYGAGDARRRLAADRAATGLTRTARKPARASLEALSHLDARGRARMVEVGAKA